MGADARRVAADLAELRDLRRLRAAGSIFKRAGLAAGATRFTAATRSARRASLDVAVDQVAEYMTHVG
jgi:hypothetical protein